MRYKRMGYNLNVMRQSACLVFNPIMVDNYAAFFHCTPLGRASDSMIAQLKAIHFSWLGPELPVCFLAQRDSTGPVVLLCGYHDFICLSLMIHDYLGIHHKNRTTN